MPRIRAIVLAILCCMPVTSMAASWWNGSWQYRKEIDLDLSSTGAGIASSLQHVPVLVRLSLANFAYFSDAKPDGADFRVVAGDDHTPLKFHFERYDSQDQMAFLWIDMPALTGGAKSDKVYVYYGNSSATAASDVPGTFDAQQALVLEFGQPGAMPVDATAYKNNPTASTAESDAASLIAGGVKFNGNQSISIPSSPSLRLQPDHGWTASAWVNIDSAQRQADAISLSEGAHEITLGIDGTRAFARYRGDGAPVTVAQTGADLGSGQWHHLAMSAGDGQMTLYVDGVAVGHAAVSLRAIGGTLTVGAAGAGGGFLTGSVDEVAVSTAARSADWIKAAARSQGQTASLVVLGEDGQKESGGQGSYFVTIARNLTVDGWAVILICISMLLIALAIMVVKALYLGSVERANGRFLRDYHHMAANMDAGALDQPETDESDSEETPQGAAVLLEQGGKYGASSLYRLYHIGIAELNRRIAGQAAGAQRAAILSPQSIEAIRASMDATLTRVQQSLSARMVLLTVAISGGPFLGLLGTVIGVMITFAAIAASGDVNINAIAPGTAAALAATVAGLAVAIPCLFGYNWLNTRIKAIGANNRVFLDEFVARLAEQYS
jgi:biopolymer transport protein ExbB